MDSSIGIDLLAALPRVTLDTVWGGSASASGGAEAAKHILTEDGSAMLLEDGSAMLLEDGSAMLLEN